MKIKETVLRNIIKEAINNELGEPVDIMDAIIMVKEAFAELQDIAEEDKGLIYELSPVFGNLRGAIKILNEIVKEKR